MGGENEAIDGHGETSTSGEASSTNLVSLLLERLGERRLALERPELVFAVVRTLGSDISSVIEELNSALAASHYAPRLIKLSELLKPTRPPEDEPERYEFLMDAGDQLRQIAGSDAVLLEGIKKIYLERQPVGTPVAYIIDSLMHPTEVATLRSFYGNRVFVISCDTPATERRRLLALKFRSRSGISVDDAQKAALHATNREAGLAVSRTEDQHVEKKNRLSVAKTLELADLSVQTNDAVVTRRHVKRLVELIMSHPFHTPTQDEFGMAVAFQASLMTATLARRVGAAIAVGDQIVATGTNEVPKRGGGVYSADTPVRGDTDGREFVQGLDTSDQIRSQILADHLRRLTEAGWLKDEYANLPTKELVDLALNSSPIDESELFDIIEYGRTVHAEMVAITGAARLGINIQDATLYTTTLPCHECTRNIIAAGISRVVYVEPYRKSKGSELQNDAVSLLVDQGPQGGKVPFEPFAGLAYHQFPKLFSWLDRKEDDVRRKDATPIKLDGSAVIWKAQDAKVRRTLFPDDPNLALQELFTQRLREEQLIAGLPPVVVDTPEKMER